MLTFFIMPAGPLVIAGVGVLGVQTWAKDAPRPGE